MGFYYLETSALVKLYVREAGTDWMVRLAARAEDHTLAVLALTRTEFRAAVRRRERQGDVSGEQAAALIGALDHHLATLYLVQPITDAVIEEAGALLDRHPLRAYDAVQLAGCLALRAGPVKEPPVFICSDHDLLRAAELERLTVLDPSAQRGPDPTPHPK